MSDDAAAAAFVQKVAPPGSDLYYALLFAGEHRDTIAGLHALAAEIAACAEKPDDPHPGRLKLQWWSEEVARVTAGEPRHPLTTDLAAPLRDAVGVEPLHRMVHNAAVILSDGPPASPSALLGHYEAQAAPLYEAIAAVVGAMAPSAAALGGAIMLIDEARYLCAEHTRFQSPNGDFGVDELLDVAGPSLIDAMRGVGDAERAPLRTALIQGELARRWLAAATRRGSYNAPPLNAALRLWAAWRTARANV
ncbi:MAG: squalene/phytoene synthase family protein [Pseudomonadota bacterium]